MLLLIGARQTLKACATLLLLVSALALHAAQAQTVPNIPFEKFTLPNGLEVILHVDRSVPIVAVNGWFKVGSVA